MPNISIILVDYNSHEYTLSCLASLSRADFSTLNVSIIIVDNGSQIPLQIDPQKYSTLDLHVIRSEENTGFTGGNNLGMQYALDHCTPKYFLLLNNDTTVDRAFLKQLMAVATHEKDVGVVCPMIYFANGREFHHDSYREQDRGNVIWFAGGSIDWKNMYAFHRGVDQVDRGQFDWTLMDDRREELAQVLTEKSLEVPYISSKTMDFATGCCMLIPRSVIDEVGMFDQSYFLYWEDVDLSYRIQQAGYSLYLAPKAKIWHINAGSTGGSGSLLHQAYQKRNRVRFAMKYAPLRTKIAVLRQFVRER